MQQASSKARRNANACIALAMLLMGVGLPAFAKKDSRTRVDEPPLQMQRELARPHAGTPLDKIVAAVEKRYGAKVVRVDETNVGGRRVYVLRLLSKDQRVVHIKVDAETGREL